MTRKIYGLLVGIDDYPGAIPKLEGCVNDVNAIEAYLRNRLDTNQYELQLRRLTTNGEDAVPTRTAVIAGFEEHLAQATEHDVALFYFSGHGSQEPAPPEFWHLEPDRMDETLVCWDSRTTDWDLADKELAYLIAQVAKKNPHILIVLDCCHSGSGTRDLVPEQGVRHTVADRRSRHIEDFIFSLDALEAIPGLGTDSEGSGWNLPQARHLLLSGCRDSELASEYAGDGQQRGAFSYFLLDTLHKTNGTLTYRELFKRASALVRSRIKTQTPQLEATLPEDLELPFLGGEGALIAPTPYFTLTYENNHWVIDAGAVHGIVQNTQLALFPLGTPPDQTRQLSAAVGEIEVTKVRPHQSVVDIVTAPENLTPDTVLNAIITNLPLPPLGVYFEGDADALEAARAVLQTVGIGEQASLYIREVEDITQAQYRLLAQDEQYLITQPTDPRPLVRQLEGYTPENARQAVENLEHIARWTAVVELEGIPNSRLPANAVKMQFYLPDGTEIEHPILHLSYQQGQPPTFRLKLTNTSQERLFCTVLDLPEDYSVSAPLFEGSNSGIWIEPGAEVWAFRRREIPATVPDDLWQQGVTEYQDMLKLIASTAEFDASLMCQSGLEQPQLAQRAVPQRNSTLNRLMQRVTTRHIGMTQVEEVDEWLTSQVTIITTRPQATVSIQTEGAASLGSGVTIEPHPSLQATARLTTVSQSTRDVAQILPSILRDNTQPFQFTTSRGVDPGLSALELQVSVSNADSLNTVTPNQPLKLSVDKTLAENEYILPVAYDGEFFVPLGRGETKEGKTEIRLERLCHPLAEKKRSLGGSVRIFFQKVVTEKLGLEYPYPILAAVEYGEDGTIRYEAETEAVKQKVTVANKIVLFMHGIIGDTQSVVPCARQTRVVIHEQEQSLNELYDLVLTFDYENLNTPIGTIAEQLGQRLEAVGLGVKHEKLLHIIAHSMGGLVARSFIEQKGGNQVVQHLMMLGTPNGGSPWSTVQDWATTVLAIGINSLSALAFPVRILGSLVAAIETIDINLDQMKPGSDFLTSLRDCPDPGVPYTILAGNTSIIPPPDAETTNKLQTFLTNLGRGTIEFPFLGQPNDLAVSVYSIKHIPDGRIPPPHIHEVACNHLVYFRNSESLTTLAETIGDIFSTPPESLIISSPVISEEPSTRESEDESPVETRVETTSSTNQGLNYALIGVAVLLSAFIITGVVIWRQSQPEEPGEPQNSSQLEK